MRTHLGHIFVLNADALVVVVVVDAFEGIRTQSYATHTQRPVCTSFYLSGWLNAPAVVIGVIAAVVTGVVSVRDGVTGPREPIGHVLSHHYRQCIERTGEIRKQRRYPTHCATQDSDYQEHTSAGQDALVPCIIKARVLSISTVLEPSTTASATTECTGFLDTAAFGTHPRWFCGHAGVD